MFSNYGFYSNHDDNVVILLLRYKAYVAAIMKEDGGLDDDDDVHCLPGAARGKFLSEFPTILGGTTV